jgi:hypothetical protein
MKKILKLSILFLIAFALTFAALPVAMAASATVNGKTVDVGDEVTYVLYLGEVPDPIESVNLSLYYNSDVLEYVEDSFSSEGFDRGLIANPDGVKGESLMNAVNIRGFDFTTTKEVIRITYKVIAPGSTDITYAIKDMNTIYEDKPGDYVSRYVLTYSIFADESEIIATQPPIINTDPKYADERGYFVNREDGLGADNGEPLDPDRTDPAKRATTPDIGQDVVIDENGNVIENSNGTPAEAAGNSSVSSVIVIIVVVLLVLLAAIVLIVILASRAINKDGKPKK